MIFVTVGTQLAFDRLVIAVDEWAGRRGVRDIFMQTGASGYQPRHAAWAATLTADQWLDHLQRARLVVSHAGMGTVITCLEYQKPVLVMPRRAALGEHRNDHQLATVARLRQLEPGAVHIAEQPEAVRAALDAPWQGVAGAEGGGRSGRRQQLVAALRAFVGSATAQDALG